MVRARRAVVAGAERAATVVVSDGVIQRVGDHDDPAYDDARRSGGRVEAVELADDEVLLPGLVDSHVHVNEPGRTQWEGFATATRAAAAGGVTTLVDMPLNSVPATTTVDALRTKQAAARDQLHVDVAFWGGIVPGNLDDLLPLHEAGVIGFKAFLVPSGVEEFPQVTYPELAAALTLLGGLDALTVVHAEDPDVIEAAPPPAGRDYGGFVASRPPEAEDRAVERLAALARESGSRVHVLHLSSAAALPAIAAARAAGVRLSTETCPHYLALTAEQVPDGATTFKCCPPIRDATNRDRLWAGLVDGTITAIVSDHSPCTPDLKALGSGDFAEAWGGIASIQLGLPVVWTEARERGLGLADVVRWMAEGPARLSGLPRKGSLAAGGDADLVAFAPDEASTVDGAALLHRNPLTPYDGRSLAGRVRRTWLRGRLVGDRPRGRLLGRGGSPTDPTNHQRAIGG